LGLDLRIRRVRGEVPEVVMSQSFNPRHPLSQVERRLVGRGATFTERGRRRVCQPLEAEIASLRRGPW